MGNIWYYFCLIVLGLTFVGCTKLPGKEYAKPRIECDKNISKSSKPNCLAKFEIGTNIDLSGE